MPTKAIEFSFYALLLSVPFSTAGIEISISAIICFWMFDRFFRKDFSIPKVPYLWQWGLFLVFCFLSIFVARRPEWSIPAFFSKYLKFFLLYVALVDKINTKTIIKRAVWVSCFSIGLVLIDGVIQYVHGTDIIGRTIHLFHIDGVDVKRISSAFSHPNDLATYLIIFIPFLVALPVVFLAMKKYVHAYASFFLLLCTGWGLAVSYSRSALIALVGATFITLFSWKKKWGAVLLISATAILLFAPFHAVKNIRESFDINSPSSGSIQDRLRMWKSVIPMIQERPLLGWGIKNYDVVFPRFAIRDAWYPHNGYLHMAAEIGLLGLGAFLLLLGTIALSLYRSFFNEKDWKLKLIKGAFLTSFLAFCLNSGVDTHLYSIRLITWFWILCALGLNIQRFQKLNLFTTKLR